MNVEAKADDVMMLKKDFASWLVCVPGCLHGVYVHLVGCLFKKKEGLIEKHRQKF